MFSLTSNSEDWTLQRKGITTMTRGNQLIVVANTIQI